MVDSFSMAARPGMPGGHYTVEILGGDGGAEAVLSRNGAVLTHVPGVDRQSALDALRAATPELATPILDAWDEAEGR